MKWDVFISHASEDKEGAARPLANELLKLGLRVWLDEPELRLGDSLQQKIDHGLSQSRFGIVILSETFFAKDWTRKELDGLSAREVSGTKAILPIRHKLSLNDLRRHSPSLAGKLSIDSTHGWDAVAKEILRAAGPTVRLSQFKTMQERILPCYAISFVELTAESRFSMIDIECAGGSKEAVSPEQMSSFVNELLVPAIIVLEILTGTPAGTARRGRLIQSNSTHRRNAYSFKAPIQGIVMKFPEWNLLTSDICARVTEHRQIDYGFMDTAIEPIIVPPGMEDLYVPATRGPAQETRIQQLIPELSQPLGQIGAMCINDSDGRLLLECPEWSEEVLMSGGDGYLLRGVLE